MLKPKKAVLFLLLPFLAACGDDYTPKPRGHFRIEFFQKEYVAYHDSCAYRFNVPTYAKVEPETGPNTEPCWKNIQFPHYRATLHLTYKSLPKFNLKELMEESRKFAYEHQIKANDIEEFVIKNDSTKMYGITYKLSGNTATPFRFFVTDSTSNFIDGAFYFNHQTTIDSIAPVQEFLLKDVEEVIKTLRWE